MAEFIGPDVAESVRPTCPECGVEMWFIGLERRRDFAERSAPGPE